MNIMKITLLPKAIFRLNEISIKFPMVFLTELEQKVSQFVWKHKRPQISKEILRKNALVKDLTERQIWWRLWKLWDCLRAPVSGMFINTSE